MRSGEPIGSEAISQVVQLGVSSATIRNELAALEEMGYLTQPHTSAGRIPTDAGYRYFVDTLPGTTRLRDPERREIVHFFGEALADVDEILRGTTHLLSRLTRYASLALAPSREASSLARMELVNLARPHCCWSCSTRGASTSGPSSCRPRRPTSSSTASRAACGNASAAGPCRRRAARSPSRPAAPPIPNAPS